MPDTIAARGAAFCHINHNLDQIISSIVIQLRGTANHLARLTFKPAILCINIPIEPNDGLAKNVDTTTLWTF